jgi:autoinducer 2-degrading protein
MFAVIVDVAVRPEMHEQFIRAITANAAACLRDEPGCLRFDVLCDVADPNRFILYEVYVDEAAFESHRATPHFARWREAAACCLAAVGGQRNTYATPILPGAEHDRAPGGEAT